MKRFVAILMCIFLSVPVSLLTCAFLLPERYGETFLGELPEKVRLLEETEGQRIVVLGGSGVAFGMYSGWLDRELPAYRAVNFGMYAALGTKVMLELALPLLREGDLIILSPELNSQTLSDYFNAEMLWQGADGAFRLLADLDAADREKLVGQLPYFAAGKLRYLLLGRPEPEGIYRRSSFDARGDILSELRQRNVMPGRFDPTMPVSLTERDIGAGFYEMLNDFAAAAEKRGAAVYFRLCPVNALAVTEGDADSFYDLLAENLRFPILGNPNDSVMDPGWFYDTNFHLNADGAAVNTRNLVLALKAELGISVPTELSVPAEPPAAGTAAESFGDGSMAELFQYAPFSDGWVITGTVGEISGRLAVPGRYADKPVYALEALVCGAEELVLPPNLAAIYDGAFAGCPRLKRIILTSERPSSCQVGTGLLDGTAAELYVPAAALDAYRVSYNWSPYAAQLHAGE